MTGRFWVAAEVEYSRPKKGKAVAVLENEGRDGLIREHQLSEEQVALILQLLGGGFLGDRFAPQRSPSADHLVTSS
jgi:hypothetical protein